VGTNEYVHAVDLVKREQSDCLLEMPPGDHGWARHAKSLGGEGDPARRLDR
jgi:hypothetical protein